MEPHDFHLQAIATGDVDLILCFNDYNLIRQTAADTILPAAHAADVGVLNAWAILRGLLTGADIDEVMAQRRYRSDDDAEPARAIWQWCREEEIDLLQLAIQFCLREKRIHGNPIGSLNVEQLEANIRAASTPLDENVWAKFEEEFGVNT
jgi:aryl-alcohol dehydrogenase-like predicted oxidoreductase